MYYLRDMCSICLSRTNELQPIRNCGDGDITYNIKLNTIIPEMDMIDDRLLCKKCCDDVDFVYKFRKQCLKSKTTLANYISQLSSANHANVKGYLTVLLTDLNDNIRNDNLKKIAQFKVIEKENDNTGSFKEDLNGEYVKMEVLNYEQDIEDTSICDFIVNGTTTKPPNTDSNITDICYNIKTEINDKLTDISHNTKYISPNDKNNIPDIETNTSYIIKEEIENVMLDSHINEANLRFDTITEEIEIKTEYGDEFIGDIDTKFSHRGENLYECSTCNRRFNQVSHLNTHMRSHTGEKPYECSTCNRSFSVSSSLKRHMLHHSGEKPHACSTCNRKFRTSSNLKAHMHSHTGEKPYECSICNKRFSTSNNLKVHMLIHTGEKPHECSLCNKRFNHITHLNRHMRSHTGEKPHECSICNKKFSESGNLKKHINSHR